VEGANFVGAASEGGPFVLFGTAGSPTRAGEVSLPDLACDSLIVTSLQPDAIYELSFSGPNVSSSPASVPPGILADMLRLRLMAKACCALRSPVSGTCGFALPKSETSYAGFACVWVLLSPLGNPCSDAHADRFLL